MSRAKVAADSAAARAAADAAERLDGAAETGRQLDLLAAPASPADPADLERAAAQGGTGAAGRGRPKGSPNKRGSKLRQMLAARGYRMPEDVLAELAGLNDRGGRTIVEQAMARAEQVLAWSHGPTVTAKAGERLALFMSILREMRQAGDALLPYGLGKMTPDQVTNIQATTINMPGSRPAGDGARVINGAAASGFAPPPLPQRSKQNQGLGDAPGDASDGGSRTK
ncbi:MAG: hypothetical protein ACJA1L_000026 [Paracoccaceae bacterium]|jgi:hypothetical protein